MATATYEPGVYPDMPEADYHGLPHLSSTVLKEVMSRTPAHALHRMETPLDSEALVSGSALHCLVLRPEDFGREFAVGPLADRRTKAGKSAWQAFEADALASGATALKPSQYRDVLQMSEAIGRHEQAKALLAAAPDREVSVIGEIGGVPCRARFDALGPNLAVDVKTTSSGTSEHSVTRSAIDFGWPIQQAFYRLVYQSATGAELPLDYMAFVVVEKTAPHFVRVVRFNAEDMAYVEARVVDAVARWSECVAQDEYPEWPVETVLTLPDWYMARLSNGGAA